jgi:hypothetical protein
MLRENKASNDLHHGFKLDDSDEGKKMTLFYI